MEAKTKQKENGQKDIILSGAPAIEKFMGRNFIALIDLRSVYEFPMKKRIGFPSLSMTEFKAWAVEYEVDNIDPKKITAAMLEAHRIKIFESSQEDLPLNSLGEIVEFTGWPQNEIIDWFKYYVGCPIKRVDRVYSVGTKELSNWMRENKMKKEHGRERFSL